MGSIMHLPWLTAPLHAASKLVEEGIQEAHAASSAATVGDSSDDESNDEVEEEEQVRCTECVFLIHPSIHPSIYPSVHPSIHPSTHPYPPFQSVHLQQSQTYPKHCSSLYLQERRRKIRARRHHKRNSSLFPASILHPPSQVDCAGCNKPIRGVCVEVSSHSP